MKDFQLPIYSIEVTFLILSVVMLLRYFLLVGIAFRITKNLDDKRIDKEKIQTDKIKKDIYWSVLSTFIFAASGTWLIYLWQHGYLDIYFDPSKYGWTYLVLSLFILMFTHDFYFYWTHRLLHKPKFFKLFHKVHHESRVPTAWTAFSFHPGEAIIQAFILPVLLLIFPVHWMVLALFLLIMTVLGIINHLGVEIYPLRFRKTKPFTYLISATHHQHHHRKVHANFGLYFNWWDLWMKTEGEKENYVR